MSRMRSDLALISEAHAVAMSAIIDTLPEARAVALRERARAAGPEFSNMHFWASKLSEALPTQRRTDQVIVDIARNLRGACEVLLVPSPVGLDRADIHG
jgi:hypothetical protein